MTSILVGLVAALVAVLPAWLLARWPAAALPMLVPGAAAVAVVLQRFVLERGEGSRAYGGTADLCLHIHSPSSPDPAGRWAVRGVISWLLAACAGVAGPEGAAVELGHAALLAARPRSARWFEQRRRTEAGSALAAGIAAAFGAPLAALLLPIELEIGGRAISTVVAALVAYVAGRGLRQWLGLGWPDFAGAVSGVGFADFRFWLGALGLGAAAGLAGAGLVRFFRYAQDSLFDLFQTRAWMRTLCAGVLLFLVILTFRGGHAPSLALLEQLAWGRASVSQAWLLFFSGVLALSMVIAGFGTVGVFWPVLALGAAFGSGLGGLVSGAFEAPGAGMAFAGAAAFWGALFGAPVAGAALAFELTQNVNLLLPCLAAATVANAIRRRLGVRALVQSELEARGLGLVEGRSAGVLAAIPVREAMVVDHELVHEQEPVSEIYPRLMKSRYPFLPVVNAQNLYTGLLTVDLIQEAWRAQSGHSNSPLSKLLEAKDLLYRGGLKGPTVRVGDRLSAAAGVFERVPCVPVLSDDGRVMGLLFIHNVRLAYDREMARRAL